MKTASILALTAILALPSALLSAHRRPRSETKTIQGTVMVVEDDNIVVQTRTRGVGTREVTVMIDERTAVTIDGRRSNASELMRGMYVVVSPVEGTATDIVATTVAPENK